MRDTILHRWIIVFILVLMLIGGGASYVARQHNYYRGLEALNETAIPRAKAQADPEPNIEALVKDNEARLQNLLKAARSVAAKNKPPQKTKTASSACPSKSIPIIKEGKIVGCIK